MSDRKEKLHIFTVLGHTFTFKDVEIVHDNETCLSFRYRAMSDGKEKVGTFWKSIMAGYSVTE